MREIRGQRSNLHRTMHQRINAIYLDAELERKMPRDEDLAPYVGCGGGGQYATCGMRRVCCSLVEVEDIMRGEVCAVDGGCSARR